MSTKIEWADESINPQGWGCWGPGGTPENPQQCWYCYLKRLQKWPGSKCELCQQLIPHWHPERLDIPKRWRKPRRIFWGSTSDLLHPYTPKIQIWAVRAAIRDTPQHTHILCTKNPARYREFNPWPDNCILLTTCEDQQTADERIPELLQAEARIRGVSHEPLLSKIDVRRWVGDYMTSPGPGQRTPSWAIIGGMTGPGAVMPDPYWVSGLFEQYRAAGVPVFLKDNLYLPEKIQEWPCLT